MESKFRYPDEIGQKEVNSINISNLFVFLVWNYRKIVY